jgi:hypothetical protein
LEGRIQLFTKILNKGWLALLILLPVIIIALGVWILINRATPPSPSENWVAYPTTDLPPAIQPDDPRWDEAAPFYLPLHAGSHGPLTEEEVTLWALYDSETIAFRARWAGPPSTQADAHFALIWHKDDLPNQRGEDCGTTCHVAQSSNTGDFQAVVPSLIPAGREAPMTSEAIWRNGAWTLTWSRPLRSPEVRDIQFVNLEERYRVRAKVFRALNEKPDWLTENNYLIFGTRF